MLCYRIVGLAVLVAAAGLPEGRVTMAVTGANRHTVHVSSVMKPLDKTVSPFHQFLGAVFPHPAGFPFTSYSSILPPSSSHLFPPPSSLYHLHSFKTFLLFFSSSVNSVNLTHSSLPPRLLILRSASHSRFIYLLGGEKRTQNIAALSLVLAKFFSRQKISEGGHRLTFLTLSFR